MFCCLFSFNQKAAYVMRISDWSSNLCSSDLILERKRRILALLQKLGQARAAIEEPLGRGVEIGTELREGRHLAILGEFELDRSCDLLHRLRLRGGTDTADRKADVEIGRASCRDSECQNV